MLKIAFVKHIGMTAYEKKGWEWAMGKTGMLNKQTNKSERLLGLAGTNDDC